MATRKIFGTQYDDTVNVFPTSFSVVTNTTKAKKAALEIYDVSDFDIAVFAGDGKDRVTIVGTSNDAVDGGAGDDVIYGGFGNDLLSGGGGRDTIYGGSGNDIIGAVRPGKVAGTTNDYVLDLNSDQIGDLLIGDGFDPDTPYGYVGLVPATPGNDILVGGNGKEILWGDNWPSTNADTSIGGDDMLFGGNGDDSLYGQGGNDLLRGGNGNDSIDGGAGNDIIDGGSDADILKGGAGVDVFVYNNALESTLAAKDVIVDFSIASQDKIDFRPLLGATDLIWSGNAPRAFAVWQEHVDGNTLVRADTTGDGFTDLLIQITGSVNLKNSDFLGVSNTAPTLQSIIPIIYNDTAGDDSFGISGGALLGTDIDYNDVVTYELDGSSPSTATGFNVEKSSTYGVLYLNSSNGDYQFVPNDTEIEQLKSSVDVNFSINATDGIADSSAKTLSITFNGTNDAPSGSASATLADGKENTPYVFSTSTLLQGFSDVEQDALSVANLVADRGTLTDNGDGTWTLKPQANTSDPVALSYEVIDGHGGSVVANQYIELSALLVFEVPVNTYTTLSQRSPSIATLGDGGWVTTWISLGQDGSDYGIYQQRYDADGRADGSEVRVNTTTASDQIDPEVTGLSDGGWVTTWTSFGQDGSGTGIYQQRYDANGNASGGEVRVNTITANNQFLPSITALSDGGWVTTWMSYGQEVSGYGIRQQRFDANGNAAGSEIRVNTTTAGDQSSPAITALADGGWVTTWMSYGQDGSGYGIYQQRFDANGSATGGEVKVNTTTASDQNDPRITGLTDGGWVTTWMSYGQDGSIFGIYQRRYDSSGNASGGEVRVNTTTADDQSSPAITALSDGGWVTIWMSYGQDGSEYGIYQQRYAPNGSAVGNEVRVNTTTAGYQSLPAIAALPDGGWVTSWESYGQDGSGWSIYQQRYDTNGSTVGMNLRGSSDADNLLWAGSGSVTLIGEAGDDIITGGFQDDLLNGGGGDDLIHGKKGIDTAAYSGASYGYQLGLADQNLVVTDSNPADGDEGSDSLDEIERLAFSDGNIQISKNLESKVNTMTSEAPLYPAIISLVDGGWLTTWAATGTGIVYQRYDAYGSATGGEVVLNNPAIASFNQTGATALADGGWITTWISLEQNGNSWDIYQQRYDASGSATGSEEQVNTTTVSNQSDPKVTGLTDGGWVTTWTSFGQDGSGYGIHQQRYDADGNANTGEVQVNTSTANDQFLPAITALSDGGWVTTWMSFGQDGSDYGIYQQRYAPNGSANGDEVRVNTTTADSQSSPAITALSDGGWVTAWMSYGQDGSSWGIYQQRFDASGGATSSEVQVNTTTASDQKEPKITSLADGGWVVTWISFGQDGSGYGIYQQRYDADGSATGGEVQVNITTASDQFAPAITGLADGGWVTTWISDHQDGNAYSIYQQRFDSDGGRLSFAITGDAASNTLNWSGAGSVVLSGGAGADTLTGGTYRDVLTGESGNDLLSGGAGADTFIFKSSDGPSVDSITDFSTAPSSSGGDILDFSASLIGFMSGVSNLSEYLQSRESNGNTIISVDQDGAASNFGSEDKLILLGITGCNFDDLLVQGNLVLS